MRIPKPGDVVMVGKEEWPILAVGSNLVTVRYENVKLDFFFSEIRWSSADACWYQRALDGVTNPVGRPRLQKGEETLRVGFIITKRQWRSLTARAQRDNVSFSEVVRRALDLLPE